jgi:hypothetical protein
MSLEKMPRWALVMLCGLAISCSLFFANRAIADGDRVKAVAYNAKNAADRANESTERLEKSVVAIQLSQETFRKEYREDQKDLDRKLGELLRAVKS